MTWQPDFGQVLPLVYDPVQQALRITGGGAGATAFIDLTDVPHAYTGAAGQYVRVKSDLTGLEFVSGVASTTDNLTGAGTGNMIVDGVDTASAVNFVAITNAAASGTVNIASNGTDSAVPLSITTKGTAPITINGRQNINGSVNTTNATVTTVLTLATNSNKGYAFKVTIVGRRTDVAGDVGVYEVTFAAKNISGTVTATTASVNTIMSGNASWVNPTAAVSGTNVLIKVQGAAAQSVSWTAFATVVEV